MITMSCYFVQGPTDSLCFFENLKCPIQPSKLALSLKDTSVHTAWELWGCYLQNTSFVIIVLSTSLPPYVWICHSKAACNWLFKKCLIYSDVLGLWTEAPNWLNVYIPPNAYVEILTPVSWHLDKEDLNNSTIHLDPTDVSRTLSPTTAE